MLTTFWRRFLYRRAGRLPCWLIAIAGQPYLERYHVASLLGCQVYLHRFVRRDAERHVHDHPWRWALSVVLAGRYTENVALYDDPGVGFHMLSRPIRWCNFITPRTRHRVADVEPETWTLFITGPRFKGWGFYDPQPQPNGTVAVLYHQYLEIDAKGVADWHLRALPGDQVGREPMRGVGPCTK